MSGPTRELLEQQIQETEGRFKAMADAAPVLLWMSRTDGLCTFFNQTWLQFTGRSLEDRAIRWLSNDDVRLAVTCFGGTIVAVESELGRTRSVLLLCLRPVPEGVEIVPVFGVHRSGFKVWDSLRVHLARRLFTAFIRKDVAFMDDMRFHPSAGGPRDPVLGEFLEYLRQLPADADESSLPEPKLQSSPMGGI